MKEDKLSDLSMQLSVDVLKLTKELRAKHETVIAYSVLQLRTLTVTFAVRRQFFVEVLTAEKHKIICQIHILS